MAEKENEGIIALVSRQSQIIGYATSIYGDDFESAKEKIVDGYNQAFEEALDWTKRQLDTQTKLERIQQLLAIKTGKEMKHRQEINLIKEFYARGNS